MEEKHILNKLNQARRALDSLSKVEIINDWQFDNKLKVWFLHLGISIEYENSYFRKKSQWYIVVKSEYPKGEIKVYPDVENSIEVTMYHQANNSSIENNSLWRKGALCLEINTLPNFQSEPYSIDDRLLYHVDRAVSWIEAAAKDKLVSDDELFELPNFTLSNVLDIQFAFSEDTVTYMQWESTECKYGIAELGVYKSKPFVYYVKTFGSIDSIQNNTVHYTQWGDYLSRNIVSPLIKAPWVLLNQVPVINEYQPPETFGDLIDICTKQQIDIMDIMKNVVSHIRDGTHHLLLLGFPIPKKFRGEPEIIFWQALYLPIVSYGEKTAKGFRNNPQGWWLRDRCEILMKNTKLDWIISENWNQKEISQRGKMDNTILRKSVLIIGAGCIGASISEILVRSAMYNLTIADLDFFEIGNLSRHTLNIDNIGSSKQTALYNHLNKLNPHANVKVINEKLSIDDNSKANIDIEKYDVIIDCTGANSVLQSFQKVELSGKHIFVSVSVGLGAKRLYITLMNGNTFDFSEFSALISPYLKKEKILYDNHNLPRNGTGCWHPTFPGRSDDIWLAASISVKVIENYILSNLERTLSLVYEQKYEDGIFEGYVVVDKKENV